MFKQTQKEKVIGNMKRDGEVDPYFSEIRHGTSLNIHHHLLMGVPPIGRVPLQSESSPSSLYSGYFCSSESSSPEEIKYQTPGTHCLNGLWSDSKAPNSRVRTNENEYKMDELNLSENFYRMNVGDGKDCLRSRELRTDVDGFRFRDSSPGGALPCNVENCGALEGLNQNALDYGAFQSSLYRPSVPLYDDRRSALPGTKQGYEERNPIVSKLRENQSVPMYSYPGCYENQINYPMERTKEKGNDYYHRSIQLQNTAMSRPCLNNGFYCSQQLGMDSSMARGVYNSHHLMRSKLALSGKSPLYHCSLLDERTGAISNGGVPLSHSMMKGGRDIEAFDCEDSIIFQGRNLNYVVNKKSDCSRGQKKNSWNEVALQNSREKSSKIDSQSIPLGVCESGQIPRRCFPLLLRPDYSSLAEVQGCMYFIAKDQHGCRFLQKIFEEGNSQDIQAIFEEIIDHIVELMMNPFGNYLVQKLLEVCNEKQRLQIVNIVTKESGELVRISLNTHGTRSVQKLIETLKTRHEISLVISALEPGFLDLIKDLNGNHVVQRCLQCLSSEDNEFIFDAAAKFCVDVATHRHGCCVLQRCIAHSVGKHQEKLVAEISANGLLLAQDAFGNYVVQYIIELKIPSAAANLISLFEGNYVQLSMQKFSSHVVEKCLRCIDESRSRIIHELLSVSHFEQLLQDPYANYVIQSALEVTKGALRASLVEVVRPHTILRTSPYCKRIFSRNLLKK
ncbi:uncharacterized protein LOC131162902 [Malania oleifera]|uniref:uncharacterized protein LOC131162902 n=1 Tax=Malania oleifera TaxID=397392 RepID=UPI0025ADFE8A|nr:uncharacterized protein LOC131162902 [Malania oleifera]